MKHVFEATALATWIAILGIVLLYGLLYSLNVIYVPKKSLERLPDVRHLAMTGDRR